MKEYTIKPKVEGWQARKRRVMKECIAYARKVEQPIFMDSRPQRVVEALTGMEFENGYRACMADAGIPFTLGEKFNYEKQRKKIIAMRGRAIACPACGSTQAEERK